MTTDRDNGTEKIIGCAFTVANTLGPGYFEKVYENALVHELGKAGLKAQAQCPIQVRYDGVVVGDFVADICVEESILVEIKAVAHLNEVHMAQCLNYLKATGCAGKGTVDIGPSRWVGTVAAGIGHALCEEGEDPSATGGRHLISRRFRGLAQMAVAVIVRTSPCEGSPYAAR